MSETEFNNVHNSLLFSPLKLALTRKKTAMHVSSFGGEERQDKSTLRC
jgi:hypothetical protein